MLTSFALGVLLVSASAAGITRVPEYRIVTKKCPTIELKGPKRSRAFNPFVYRAQIKNYPKGSLPLFKWSVIGARITEGQGTGVIRVQPVAPRVTATLMLENAPAGCGSNKASFQTEMTNILGGLPPSIRSVELSTASIVRPCPSGTKSDSCSTTSNQVQVTVDAGAPDEAEVILTWEVTAGRVIGKGEKVIWDLSGVPKGTYTITAEAEYSFAGWTDGHKVGGSATLTISDCTGCKPMSQ